MSFYKMFKNDIVRMSRLVVTPYIQSLDYVGVDKLPSMKVKRDYQIESNALFKKVYC